MSTVMLIFKKELRDMFRDKRVRTMALVTPSLIIIMMIFMLGFVQDQVTKPSNMKIHIVKSANPLVNQLLDSKKMTSIEINSVEEGEQMIQHGDARLVIAFEEPKSIGAPTVIDAYYDPKREISSIALQGFQEAINQQNKKMLITQLKARNIPVETAEQVKLVDHKVQVGGASDTSAFIVQLLPYLIVIWAFYGGMSIATELVAGEKEKNTLETLLIAPATRTQIAFGKFLSLAVVCLISSLSSFVGLFVVQSMHTKMTEKLFPHGIGVTPESSLLILAVLIPAVALFASLLLAISTYAKNPREAQTLLAGVSFVVLMPAITSQFIGFTDFASSRWLYMVPVLNTATILRQILQAQINTTGFLTCVAISLVLAAIGIRIAVGLFNREQVLSRI